MFKPARLLQVSFFSLFLASCASTEPTSLPAAAPTPSAPAQPTDSAGYTPTPMAEPEPIKAGQSIISTAGFLQDNGQLKPNIQAYAQEVADTRGVPLGHVEALLKQAQYNASAVKLMTPSKTRIRRSWVTYRNRFVEPIRINAGETFWTQNKAMLDQTARYYGVPPSIIVAIIGVETVYGRNTGNFRVLDALTTLGFRYPDSSRPERSQLFRDQLADLIQLDYENKLDASRVTGSFAGAMGLPQFMPGSLMRYAADGNHDGVIDLQYSTEDAIASVAQFLRLHGWIPGLPVFAPVDLPPEARTLVTGGLYPTLDWAQLQGHGATVRPTTVQVADRRERTPAGNDWKRHKLGVVDLLDEPRNLAEYRLGTPNFFAITHYNRSYFYATSVAELASAIADRMGYGGPN